MTEKPDFHPDIIPPKVAVLLVNLGTPDAPTAKAVRRYLAEFLSDKRVVELPDLVWKPILHGIVLTTRPRKSAAAYAKVWMEEGSPLAVHTKHQVSALQAALGDSVHVDYAMRYGRPGIGFRLEQMKAEGYERILLAPLYPQYCGATTATVVDEAGSELADMRWQPTLRVMPPYHDDPAYIEALGKSIKTHLGGLDFEPEHLVASYHGIPKSYFDKGDPYHCQCLKTSRLLNEHMGWSEDYLLSTFQSRFGPEEWLQPYTDKTVERLAREGIKRIAVINPGFSSDCLETLEEIDGEVREEFIDNGGEHFTHIPCLNDSKDGMDLIETIVRRELLGWI